MWQAFRILLDPGAPGGGSSEGGGGVSGVSSPAITSGGGAGIPTSPSGVGGPSGGSTVGTPSLISSQGQAAQNGPITQPAAPGFGTPGPESQPVYPGTPPPTPQTAGIREALAKFGVQLPYENDEAALHGLANAWQTSQQRNYLSELGSQVAPVQHEFQQWQAERQRQQQAQQAQTQKGPWNPPQFDDRHWNLVEQDPQTGQLRSKAGYDPRIGQQAQSHVDYINASEKHRLADPIEWGKRMFAPMFEEMASKLIGGQIGEYKETVQANNIISQNNHWLYSHDQGGRVSVNPQTGRPQLSPSGTRYYQYLEHAINELGIKDIGKQHKFAMDYLERDALRAGRQQQQAQQQAPQVPGGAFQQGQVNQLQATQAPGQVPAQPTIEQNRGLSLAQMLKADFHQAGLTNENMNNDIYPDGVIGSGGF